MKKCTNCGAEVKDNLKFCTKCGCKLETEVKEEKKEEAVTPKIPTIPSEEPKKEEAVVEKVEEQVKEKLKKTEPVKVAPVKEEAPKTDTNKAGGFVEKYLTKKNLFLVELIAGVVLVLTLLFSYFKLKDIEYTELESGLTSIRFLCTIFFLALFVNILVLAGFIYKLAKEKDKGQDVIIALVGIGACLLFYFILYPTVNSISRFMSALTSGNWYGMATYAAQLDDIESKKPILFIFIFIHAIVSAGSGYFFYTSNSGKDVDLSGVKEKMAEIKKDPKKKQQATIVAAVCGALVIGLVGFGVYSAVKKTPVNLVTGCEIGFEGHDGSGSVTYKGYDYGCSPDYDKTNEKISTFMSGVSYTLDKSNHLKNGDTVTLIAKYSEETAKSAKVKVTESKKTFKVKGLTKVYKTWNKIPSKLRNKITARADKKAKNRASKETYQWFVDNEVITVNSVDRVAILYDYSDGYGSVAILYKADITSTSEEETEDHTEYYKVTLYGIDGKNKDSSSMYIFDYNYYSSKGDEPSDVLDDFRDTFDGYKVVENNVD